MHIHSTLGTNSFWAAVGKCGSPAWAFAQHLWPKPSALEPVTSLGGRA
jgi:hypothetical protein